jgi:outer membrane protein OmpA-like peptidoglycan-associated protein
MKTSEMSLRVAVIAAVVLTQGCATRDYVRETVDPVTGRVSRSEARLDQVDGQVSGLGTRIAGTESKLGQVEGRVGKAEGRIGQVETKADKALADVGNLRLERRLVVDMKDGATFGNNSINLSPRARKEIDSFLDARKSDTSGSEGLPIIVIAGHADSLGSPDVNYEIARRRAEAVSRYLITRKQVNPLHVRTISYGETSPREDNKTRQGRAANRRVEILVYREAISTAASGAAPAKPAAPVKAPPQT